MMKFKSLFRRGQQSHSSHQKQNRQQQRNSTNQQVAAPQQCQGQQQHRQEQQATAAVAEVKSSRRSSNDWLSSSSTSLNYRDPRSSTGNGPVPGIVPPKNQQSSNSSITLPHPASSTSTRPSLTDCIARIQELERENEALKMERARLEASYRNAETRRFEEQHAEILHLKEQHSLELERLAKENEALRSRLRDVVHSPLSDSEKQQLLDASRLHNSAPASIAVLQEDNCAGPGGNMTQENARSATPEWDKRSSSSEVSVACLQDRILQMEETHYSTNEELQATIQELSDLQAQLTELQADNDRLAEEKGVLLESLCRQTEKLEDSRSKVDTLQGLLLRDEQPQESKGYNTEREQKLVDLLKSAQEERESLLRKQEELTTELKALRASTDASSTDVERLTKRVHFLESTIDAANVERKLLDMELAESKQESANRNIEISRLATLLDNARAKIEELEQSRQLETKSEADEMLDAARREKDTLETQAAALQEQLARSHCDHDRLRDQYSQLQEEFKVARNNAKSAIEELEYRLSQLKEERISVTTELQLVRDSLSELQSQCQRHLEDKREMKAVLSELQRRERDAQSRQIELERALTEERRLREEESAEWQQFQTDLLMTVRVANDFKTEAQSELERVVLENKAQRDRLRALEAQLDKLNSMSSDVQKPRSTILKRGRTIVKKRFEPIKLIVKSEVPRTKGILKNYVPKTKSILKNHMIKERENSVWFDNSNNSEPIKFNLKPAKDTFESDFEIFKESDIHKSCLNEISLKRLSNISSLSLNKKSVPININSPEKYKLSCNLNSLSCQTPGLINKCPEEKSTPKIIDSIPKICNGQSPSLDKNLKLYSKDENDGVSVNKQTFNGTGLQSDGISTELINKNTFNNTSLQLDSLEKLTGIQNNESGIYNNNVSNSRFFVPNNYGLTKYENSMDDITFKMDPEITHALRKSLEEKTRKPNHVDRVMLSENIKSDIKHCKNFDNQNTKLDLQLNEQKINSNDKVLENKEFDGVELRNPLYKSVIKDSSSEDENNCFSKVELRRPRTKENSSKSLTPIKDDRPFTENLQLSRSNFLRNSIHETQPANLSFRSRNSFSRNSLELTPSATSRFPITTPKLVQAMRQKFEDLPSLRLKDSIKPSNPMPHKRYAGNFDDAVSVKPKPLPRRLIGSKSQKKTKTKSNYESK